MTRLLALAAVLAALSALPAPAFAAGVPTKPGRCVATTIKDVGTRLEGVADSGSAVEYADGIFGVTYDQVPEVEQAKPGDKVELCLVSLPTGCPAGDDRGKIYAAFDLRTQRYWQLPDAEHMCGGA